MNDLLRILETQRFQAKIDEDIARLGQYKK